MKKYLLLLENHKSGFFLKGSIIEIPETSLDAWMETEIVEEVTEKEFNSYSKKKEASNKKAVKDAKKKHSQKVEKIDKKNIELINKEDTKEDTKEKELGN